ncbi:putative U3 small nucleolar RNA-associated protein 7 [Psilocybe cubensis]|uniref:U three protein 7 n=2 Tax=Psilocybe cubensis TaxID=181762 RepID=A0A8H7XUD2_PSICU|nr:putative U3 small nucleolar RNA-associated protein 7 [Psilocybe cubensis]KAH9475805.1 putative U3 small nucleolar RNA-associated protein 7 [Psilocybe cubensis]
MDSLIAKADAIRPLNKKRKTSHPPSKGSSSKGKGTSSNSDYTLNAVVSRTSIPKSLQDSRPIPEDGSSYKHIANKKLRTQLNRQAAQGARAKALLEDAEMLLMDEAGGLEVEGEMDRTWRVGQSEIVQSAGQEAAKGRREYKLDGGPYRSRYTRNGRHLAIAGRNGHVSTFDWQTGTIHAELQLQETCRDITFLQDHSFFAVAQKKYVFIYDRDGVEVHCLKAHIEPTRLEFLPYHWLLASVGNPGYLKYQDTSTGQLLVEHRTKMGACTTMTQNLHNAVIHLGHQNGCVTLWTPNLPHPAVQLLAHVGPVVSVAVDPSQGGRYMATAGRDGTVKVWDCRNWKGAVRDWTVRGGGDPEVEWSARGYLAVASSGTVNVYNPPSIHTPFHVRSPPPLYMTHPIPHRPLTSVRFAPFQDILTVGHSAGLSSVLVPGSGEPNFDSREADPFENKKARSEREVKALLDKIQPDLITLDPEMVGNLAPVSKLTTEMTTADGKPKTDIPYARLPRIDRLRVSGKLDEAEDDAAGEEGEDEESKKRSKEEREKRKMRGKGKSMKRYLRKQRKNVIDPAAIAIRAKLEKQKEEKKRAAAAAAGESGEKKKPSALDRFKRSK